MEVIAITLKCHSFIIAHSAILTQGLCVHFQLPVLRRILQEEGWPALWRGWKPRVLLHVPASAVCWGTYETIKRLLRFES